MSKNYLLIPLSKTSTDSTRDLIGESGTGIEGN
jgi:hypothetical protein